MTITPYRHRVAFHETDAMGVVHHSNHIKYFEEARVHWLREKGFAHLHVPHGPYVFAVTETECRYLRTARFEDSLSTYVEGRMEGARLKFRYAILNERTGEWIAEGTTALVPLNAALEPVRLPAEVRKAFNADAWGDAWPPAAGGSAK